MAFWWVNHKQTRDFEVQGDYLWSPKFNQNGARNQSYDNMVLAREGDIVFSYADGQIASVGVVLGDASTAPKPIEFGKTGIYWSDEGWYLPVGFQNTIQSIRPKDYLPQIAPLLSEIMFWLIYSCGVCSNNLVTGPWVMAFFPSTSQVARQICLRLAFAPMRVNGRMVRGGQEVVGGR